MSWKDELPEELRNDPTISATDSLESLAKQLVDSQRYVGQSIRIPGEGAGTDEWSEFDTKITSKVPNLMKKPDLDNLDDMRIVYTELGRPEEAKSYRVPEVETPEGVELADAPVERFRALAHEAGLNQKQFENIVSGMRSDGVREVESGIQKHNDEHRELNREWGLAADDRKQVADKTRREFFPDMGDVDTLPADMVKGLYKMGEQLGSEATGLTADLGVQRTGRLPPDEAQMQLAEIGRNKSHPYWNASDPAHHLWGGENGKYVDLMRQAKGHKN